MDRFSPNATFVFPRTLPTGGTYDSPWDGLEFTTTGSDRVEVPHPEPEQFIRDGDRVVMLGTWHAVVPSSGRRVAVRVAHLFTWSGEGPLAGREATSFELICDTARFAAALAERDPG